MGTGPVFIDNVQCIGNETRLTDCYHNGVGTHNCDHSDDVGVACQLRMLRSSVVCIIIMHFKIEKVDRSANLHVIVSECLCTAHTQ